MQKHNFVYKFDRCRAKTNISQIVLCCWKGSEWNSDIFLMRQFCRKLRTNKCSNGDKSIYLNNENRYKSLNISIAYTVIVISRDTKALKLILTYLYKKQKQKYFRAIHKIINFRVIHYIFFGESSMTKFFQSLDVKFLL